VPYVTPRLPQPGGELAADREAPLRGRPFHFFDLPLNDLPAEDPLETAAAFWAHGGSRGIAAAASVPSLPVRLQTHPVDHSLFGAVGMAVESDAGWIGYTGDLRFHGQKGERTWAFAEALAQLKPTALLCEGTRLTGVNTTTEARVRETCRQAVRRAAGRLAVADFAPRNVERLLTFLEIAGETGRRLLVQPKDAYLLRAMHLADPGVPDAMADARLGLYADPKVSQFDWEKRVRQRYAGRVVTPLDVRQEPGDYLLAFSLTDMADLLDIEYLLKGKPGGVYVFSNSQAYDDEQMVDLVRLWNWTEHLGLTLEGLQPHRDGRGTVVKVTPTEGYHASGHAAAAELEEFVRRVQPRRLIAIHTENAQAWQELLRGTSIELVIPRHAEPIRL
jgi:ribonuclease J